MKRLPEKGATWVEVKELLQASKTGDSEWKRGRLPLYVYWRDDELCQVAREAASMFFMENGLGKKVFPSVQQLERDVVAMTLDLLNGGPNAVGNFTTGGTESIFLAVKTARDFARKERKAKGRLKIVAPLSAHPAFDKAAHYLDMEVVRTPLRQDFRGDPKAIENAVDDKTVMVVASAPAYPHGVFDPIEDIARIATVKNLWLHVDACVGGMLAPFARDLGYDVPPFDFSVGGVTSMSADLHKYGLTAKGASVVLFKDEKYLDYLRFKFSHWPRGNYVTETFLGTRAASPVASAWAVMHYLGREGYQDIARTTLETKARFEVGISAIRGLEILKPNDLSFLLYRSNDKSVDIDAVAEGMSAKGWFVGRCNAPPSIHLMFNPVHAPVVQEYLNDLASVVDQVRSTGRIGSLDESTY
ncbi:aminotransferase class V-fold PLP-dependent enzyme [Sinorhizobium medicae]|nr:aminotransferase class V-fold PLP-dependent enzyme [Sinorhizobium medicae]MDX1243467.1 aminotransferase class V-fold PLP-dependent enzyme [Sinorhizobium medicae]